MRKKNKIRRSVFGRFFKYLLYLILLLTAIIPAFNLLFSGTVKVNREQVCLVAHRGGASLAPENTLAAMISGITQGADILELDIRQTKDNQIVVMHDHSVDRTTSGEGKVEDLTLEQIKGFNAAKNWASAFKNAKVPLLSEVIDRVKQSKSRLIIEIKDPQYYPGMVKSLIELIRSEKCQKKMLVFSFNEDAVQQVKRALPDIETGVFIVGYESISQYKGSGIKYICPNWYSILYFPWLVDRIHQTGCKILVWTPDQKWAMNYLLRKRVNGIITNSPDIFNAIFNTPKN